MELHSGLHQHWRSGEYYIALGIATSIADKDRSTAKSMDVICIHTTSGIQVQLMRSGDGKLALQAINPAYQAEIMGKYAVFCSMTNQKHYFMPLIDWFDEIPVTEQGKEIYIPMFQWIGGDPEPPQ